VAVQSSAAHRMAVCTAGHDMRCRTSQPCIRRRVLGDAHKGRRPPLVLRPWGIETEAGWLGSVTADRVEARAPGMSGFLGTKVRLRSDLGSWCMGLRLRHPASISRAPKKNPDAVHQIEISQTSLLRGNTQKFGAWLGTVVLSEPKSVLLYSASEGAKCLSLSRSLGSHKTPHCAVPSFSAGEERTTLCPEEEYPSLLGLRYEDILHHMR
jgi:hypothetical protein